MKKTLEAGWKEKKKKLILVNLERNNFLEKREFEDRKEKMILIYGKKTE